MMLLLQELEMYTDCFQPHTQLIINPKKNQLEINLLKARECDFPAGVFVDLRFSNPDLDVQVVLTNYSVLSDNLVQFSVKDAKLYLDIMAVSLQIMSYSAEYQHEIQEISILRLDDSQVIKNVKDAQYDGNVIKMHMTINILDDPVIYGVFSICTMNCEDIISDSVIQVDNEVDINFKDSQLTKGISIFGVSTKSVTIYYGDKVISSATSDDFSLVPTYQVHIGQLQEAFLYIDQVFISIKSNKKFQEFLQGFQHVGISFFYDTCNYSLTTPISIFKQSGENIDIIFNQKLFKNPEQFLSCQNLTYFKGSQLQMKINFTNIKGTSRYELEVNTTRSCYYDTDFIIYNNDLSIQTKVLPLCKTSKGNYQLQIQTYKSLTDQVIDNKIVIYETPVVLTGETDIKIKLTQNKTLQHEIIAAYSVFFVLVDDGSEMDDQQMELRISKVDDFLIYIGVTLIMQLALSGIIGGLIIFIKPKPKKVRKQVKNIELEDIQ